MLIRKAMGTILPMLAVLLILTSTFTDVRDRIKWLDLPLSWIEQNTTPWFLGGLLAISLWQPDARLSPAIFSMLLASLVIKKFDKNSRNRTLWAFWGLLVFAVWEIWNHIPRAVTGMSLQQSLKIDFLYKFQQQLVLVDIQIQLICLGYHYFHIIHLQILLIVVYLLIIIMQRLIILNI